MNELSLARYLRPALQKSTDTRYVDYDGSCYSGRDMLDTVDRLRTAFSSQLGLSNKDHYSVIAGNSFSYLALWAAAHFGVGVIVPVNTRLHSTEVRHILSESKTNVIFTDSIGEALVWESLSAMEAKPVVVSMEGRLEKFPDAILFSDLLQSSPMGDDAYPEEEDIAVLGYTGGTTGLAKGAIHTQKALVMSYWRHSKMWPLNYPNPCFHLSLPLFHVGGSMVGTMIAPLEGLKLIIRRDYNPGQLIEDAKRYKITCFGGAPTMLQMLLDHPDFDAESFKTVRHVIYGAATMPIALLERINALFPQMALYQSYGMTEAGTITQLGPLDHVPGLPRLNSVGRVLPGVEMQIRDESGQEVEDGKTGEIWLRADALAKGYYCRPEETTAAFIGGWFRTGDAGYFDDDGYLYMVDRVKDIIITGGENVYSTEVEQAVASHPSVQQVAVIGVPHKLWGEAVHAIVVPHPGALIDEEDLSKHARASIAGYKVPKSWTIREEPLPLSGASKVLKKVLREQYAKVQ